MLNMDLWMGQLREELLSQFPDRLLFLGLQGSRRRGEAQEESDIDVVAVFDRLTLVDLNRYRKVVAQMPEGEKGCGFVCGRAELYGWPRHELFQLEQDTQPYYGSLRDLLPPISKEDLTRCVKIGAANLYHETCHRVLYDDWPDVEKLKDAFKAACFTVTLQHYLETGEYLLDREQLRNAESGDRKQLLTIFLDWKTNPATSYEELVELLLRWSSAILAA